MTQCSDMMTSHGRQKSISQSIILIFFNDVAKARNSYFKEHKGEEQLKGKTSVGATE